MTAARKILPDGPVPGGGRGRGPGAKRRLACRAGAAVVAAGPVMAALAVASAAAGCPARIVMWSGAGAALLFAAGFGYSLASALTSAPGKKGRSG